LPACRSSGLNRRFASDLGLKTADTTIAGECAAQGWEVPLMICKFAAIVLAAAFMSASIPAVACTGISLKAKDGAAIRGRTLEFGFPMQSNVIVVPAGKELSGTLPDGGKGLSYTSRYAVVGANALNLPVILDGLNDQGLSVGLFYFPNYAKYTDVTPENAKHAIAPHEFGLWVLANFASVDEVKDGVKSIVVVPTPAPGLGSPKGIVAGAHFFIQDKTDKSIAVEPVDGTLKVHDAAARHHDQRADLRLAHDQSPELHQPLGQGCGRRQARAGHAAGLRLWLRTA
jgi:penicillin V acylase-like amidase (Ntn superfamily)